MMRKTTISMFVALATVTTAAQAQVDTPPTESPDAIEPAPSDPVAVDAPPETLPAKAEPPPMPHEGGMPEPWSKLMLHGWVDAGFTANLNVPDSGRNFVPAVGTSGQRANEFAMNHAAIDLALNPDPVGFRLILATGVGNEFLHSFEPDPDGSGFLKQAFQFVQQASVTWNLPIEGLSVEAGIIPAHLGAELMFNKDNWTYTRAWIGDYVPFYNSGLRVGYTSGPLVLNAYVLNGWGIINDNNLAKSFGAQLGFVTPLFTAYLNGWAGPEIPLDNDNWRFVGDTVVIVNPTDWLAILATGDVGLQQQPDPVEDSVWWGAALTARIKPMETLAFALRGDAFGDAGGFVLGTADQTMYSGAAVIDVLPTSNLIFRLEGRLDYATVPVFEVAKGGTSNTEVLLSSGLIAYF